MSEDNEPLRRVQGREIAPSNEQEIKPESALKAHEVLEEEGDSKDIIKGVRELAPGTDKVKIEEGEIKNFGDRDNLAKNKLSDLYEEGKIDAGTIDSLFDVGRTKRVAKTGKILRRLEQND